MCNYFGGACAGPREEDLKRYSKQAQNEYMAMLANAQWNRPQGLERLAATPDPMSRPQIALGADYMATRHGWLTQSRIDNYTLAEERIMKRNDHVKWYGCTCKQCNPPRRSLRQWLGEVPGGVSTVLVLVAFLLGCLGVWLIWQFTGGK